VGFPLSGPQDGAGLLVERHGALDAFRAFGLGEVQDEYAAGGDGRPGESRVDGRAPFDFEAFFREGLEDARLAPHALASAAAPPRPVFGGGGGEEEQGEQETWRPLQRAGQGHGAPCSYPAISVRRGESSPGRRPAFVPAFRAARELSPEAGWKAGSQARLLD